MDQYNQAENNMNIPKVISVIHENLNIGKKVIETGKVNISKKILTEEYTENVPVFREEIIVEKKSINQFIEGDAPGIRLDGDVTIIPIIKEVIIKKLLLVEEIHVTKRRIDFVTPITESLRKEELTVTRTSIPANNE